MRPDRSNSVPSFSHPESDSPGGPVPRSSGPAATAPPARSRRRRCLLADGSVVRCSRTENSELFSLTLGGYGLFGIILEADLRVVPNVRLRLQQEQVATTTASALLDRLRQEPHPALVYARLNVTTDRRFGQVRVSAYYPDTNGTVPALREPGMPGLSRAVFRGSAGSDLRTFGGASSRRPVNRPR